MTAFGEYEVDGTAGTMKQRDYKDATDLVVAVAFEPRFVRTTGGCPSDGLQPCLRADTNAGDGAPCVAIADVIHSDKSCNGKGWNDDGSAYTLDTMATQGLMQASCVRRLTPIETERLMGFQDNWTRIPWRNKPAADCPDGPRYKACGNSMGVNVMRWIGTRIQEVEEQK
jgi:DNA (cytosine-5)-methyltransferase 1